MLRWYVAFQKNEMSVSLHDLFSPTDKQDITYDISRENLSSVFFIRFNTNWAVQQQKMARSLKLRI